MKTNLSRSIKLTRIPTSYYRPSNEVEKVSLSREEKINVDILESAVEGARFEASRIVAAVAAVVAEKGRCVMALGSGNGVLPVYEALIELYNQGRASFKDVEVFSMAEFYPTSPNSPSTLRRLRRVFLDHVDVAEDHIHTLRTDVSRSEVFAVCRAYDAAIRDAGGIDIALFEVGINGSVAFNEPGSKSGAGCRLVLLGNETRHRVAADYKCEEPPTTALTLGLGDLMAARQIFCSAWGEDYVDVVKKMVEDPMTDAVPASVFQLHRRCTLVTDLPAAEGLTRLSRPWRVTSCEWDDKLTRRAIVWLCGVTGKPILKLTDRDYNDHGLGELLALYGSAYNVNIKIFNDLQHTITGWPGGKPGADDATRPERARPYPKRIVVFSPHPDDDVISMGGTLKRLVDQGHDVYVAYETSGNIAVGDEDLMRYVMLIDGLSDRFGLDTTEWRAKSDEIHRYIRAKNPDDVDTPDIRRFKTVIRQCEARTACRYMGVADANVRFLGLPFYETGTIKKGDLGERDVARIIDLLKEIRPDEMFVAGDLADPHGTHRVCLDAVLAAIDELKDEEWMKNCYVWMYRGAWAEWEIDHIEMAVPLSPEELRFKRNSILKHQSQMENAPFLGDDDRLFWQRAEERNRATARLYSDLGLASYEAIEAFVRYRF